MKHLARYVLLFALFSLASSTMYYINPNNVPSCSGDCGNQQCCQTSSGKQCYFYDTHRCISDSQNTFHVCPAGYAACGGACYLPKDYCCPDGQLTQAQFCATSQTASENLPSIGNVVKDGNFSSSSTPTSYDIWDFAYYGGTTYTQPLQNPGLRLGDPISNVSQSGRAPAKPLVFSFSARGGGQGNRLTAIVNGKTVFVANGALSSDFTTYSFGFTSTGTYTVRFVALVQSYETAYYVANVVVGVNPDYFPGADGNYYLEGTTVTSGYYGNQGSTETIYTPANTPLTLTFQVLAGDYPYDSYFYGASWNGVNLVSKRLPRGDNYFSFPVQSSADGKNTFGYSKSKDGRDWSTSNITVKKN